MIGLIPRHSHQTPYLTKKIQVGANKDVKEAEELVSMCSKIM